MPVKLDYVKEVEVCRVTLHLAKIWKKIQNNKSKPDQCWQSMERQLKSPTTIRKSKNCNRANATKVNFNRIGPLGEVGV